ncbi:MAG TPA: ASCH domain-containing protein [Solirubrobacteraceae bacterium]|nr:ASCH domain-containing protein [Solirubrobacteraceae bacterium]
MTHQTALSVRQPWAWAIIHAHKDVENRSWPTRYRGPLLIHAGKREDPEGWAVLEAMRLELPLSVPTGGIIGTVDLIDCVQGHPSRWAQDGCWHWLLSDARPLPFRACKGSLGLFQPSSEATR